MKPGEPFNPRKMFVGVFIPDALLSEPRLSMGAKLMFGVLAKLAGENGYCWPSQSALARACGCSDREVRNRLAELCRFGLLRVSRRGNGRSNSYQFIWHPIYEPNDTRPENFADPTGTNVPVTPEQTFRSQRNERSCQNSPQPNENPRVNVKKRVRQEKSTREIDKRNKASYARANSSAASEDEGQQAARAPLAPASLDLSQEILRKALEPHAKAIGQPISDELIERIREAAQGKPLAAASLIAKTIQRRFADTSLPGYRQPWPASLAYWVRVVREEIGGLT
ncbi:MAG: helix-turn-helix domain-containing protein [Anaerolineae bacterium]|nr:helix-turn-helix domain-containing protein [Anaerolineae bacterium]